MTAEFDPYREWLGVKSPQRPPNYYQLLDLKVYESDRQKIENAEMIQMAKVLRHDGGPHAPLAARLSRELEEAVRCLSDPLSKAAYDADLFVAPHAQQPDTGEFQIAPLVHAEVESSAAEAVGEESSTTVSEAGAPLSRTYSFADDLKLDEDTTEEEDFSDDLKLPDEDEEESSREPVDCPQTATPPAPVARRSSVPAEERQPVPEPEPQRPSLMEMLDKPARAKDSKGQKSPEREKKAAKPLSYDPPPLAAKPRLPSLQLSVSGKQMGGVAAFILVGLAVWYFSTLPPSGPDPADVLAMIENPNPQTRIYGIDGLRAVEIDPQQSATVLVKVLREDQVDDVRVAAVSALVNNGIPNQQVSGELKTMLATEKHPSVKAMLQWLLEQGTP